LISMLTIVGIKKNLRRIADILGFLVFGIAVLGAVYSPLLWSLNFEKLFDSFVFLIFFALYAGSIAIIVLRVHWFDRHTESLYKLLVFYFEMILLFAGIYLWLYLIGDDSAISGFSSINREMLRNKSLFKFDIYKKNIFKVIVDSVHFSVVTSTTIGYGDMLPKHPIAKIVVDVQALLTVGIIVIGYGRYSRRT
jgi:Ion channel